VTEFSEEDYKLFRYAISSLQLATIVDVSGKIRYIGESYAKILGTTLEAARGQPVQNVIPDTEMPKVLRTGQPQTGSIFIMKNRVPIIVDRLPIYDESGVMKGAISVTSLSDVSSMHKLSETISALERENELYRNQLDALTNSTFSLDSLIGVSPSMRKLKNTIQKVAPSDLPILITGKTGTGKEIVADAIHYLSKRRFGKFVKINCAAIPKDLLESELFGYREGAFTGASKGGKIGKFQAANDGTLLLDEIGELPMQLQSKLLRVLQEHEVERIGDVKSVPFNARIICSTNRDLLQMISEGTFREDLYYRINVVELHVPPLRKRKEDIPALCNTLIKKINHDYGCNSAGVSDSMLSLFGEYDWPGNVRELEHVLERAVVLSPSGVLKPEDFDFFLYRLKQSRLQSQMTAASEVAAADDERSGPDTLQNLKKQAERDAILSALSKAGGNKSKAAKLLGIQRSLLYVKMKAYGIDLGTKA
jgi:transcriptional regulator with PAS, ATPase and Fis domain